MPSADVSHARPLRAVVPNLAERENGRRSEDYSEFLICVKVTLSRSSVLVCVKRNAALARTALGGKKEREKEKRKM